MNQVMKTDLVGKRVLAVSVNENRDNAEVSTDSGEHYNFILRGECCSSSYYTADAQWQELVGAKVLRIEDRSSDQYMRGEQVERVSEWAGAQETEHLLWYFLVFVTDRGYFTIDWRNDSNGYYSGWVELDKKPRASNP